MPPRRTASTKKSAFVDSGQYSADESTDGELDDFVCNSSPESRSGSPKRKRLMTRAATSSSSESYQGDALDCQGEKQLRARALPESSDDGLGMIPMKRKRLRKNEHETISDCVPDAEDPDLVDFEDPQPSMCCSSVLGCMDKFGEKVDKCGEEMEHRVEGLDGSEQNVKDGARCDEHQSGLAFVSSKSSKNEGLGLKRKSRRNLAESRTESTLLQQIMENQGRVLGKLKDNSTTSSTTSSINEHDLSDSEGLQDFIVDEPISRPLLKEKENLDEDISQEDLYIDVRRLPKLALFRIYVDFLVRMKYDVPFKDAFACDKHDKNDCRIQAAQKLEAKICDLMDWAVESASHNREILDQLRMRPCIEVVSIPSVTHCQICNRRRNPATFRVRLHGPPCCPEWIIQNRPEHVGKSPDASSDLSGSMSGSEESEPDESGDITVAVGKFCCCRIRLYHGMVHFKRRLSEYICAHINKQMESYKKNWEDCLTLTVDSTPMMERLLGYYDSLVSIAQGYISCTLPQATKVEFVHSKLKQIEESLDAEKIEISDIFN